MHSVKRSTEPGFFAELRAAYTGWDDLDGGARRRIRDALFEDFGSVCAYCECQCEWPNSYRNSQNQETIDHFRPLSRFPALAYDWSNWVFSCRRCNENKGNGWPEPGYVDPCADVVTERPERYFGYDAKTGEIIPKRGLAGDARLKAVRTINDLGLNKLDVQHYRFDHTQRFIRDLRALPVSERQAFIAYITERSVEYAGVTGMVVEQEPELLREN